MQRLSVSAAEQILEGVPVIPAMAGSIAEMKALRDRCLDAGIPALVGCPSGAGTPGGVAGAGRAGRAGQG